MHTRIQLKITSVALALLGLLPFCAPTRAAMPMNDTFTDGGRTNGGMHWVTPWGISTKGKKTRHNKKTDGQILRRRHASK